MISEMLISHSDGITYYSRSFGNGKLKEIKNADLLGGLFSVIRQLGKKLFNKKRKIASIKYDGKTSEQIVIISKDRIMKEDAIFFVFFVKGDVDMVFLKRLTDAIFINIKQFLTNNYMRNGSHIKRKVDTVLKREGLIGVSEMHAPV